MSTSLWPCELQHARLPCPSPTPRVTFRTGVLQLVRWGDGGLVNQTAAKSMIAENTSSWCEGVTVFKHRSSREASGAWRAGVLDNTGSVARWGCGWVSGSWDGVEWRHCRRPNNCLRTSGAFLRVLRVLTETRSIRPREPRKIALPFWLSDQTRRRPNCLRSRAVLTLWLHCASAINHQTVFSGRGAWAWLQKTPPGARGQGGQWPQVWALLWAVSKMKMGWWFTSTFSDPPLSGETRSTLPHLPRPRQPAPGLCLCVCDLSTAFFSSVLWQDTYLVHFHAVNSSAMWPYYNFLISSAVGKM